ncbi:hypothetical protein B0H16DRAFT_1639370 [Mycena metata]|uniref:Uncharacterized protein n=1 Tax=Mycena metata TaxID=1033252 RepID=A0AAD7GR08_9AGAR|nr:hypothetical protein B0H16DRAFT_1639370 [Mycena metata]
MPLAPLYSGALEIHYDAQGKAYVRDRDGNFVPYGPPDARACDAPSQPIEQAFNFFLRPVQDRPSQQHPIPIDPALQTPLPRGPYLDLTHPGTIADAKGLKRANKVAGSRCNGKSKGRADSVPKKCSRAYRVSSDSDSDEPPSKRGKGAELNHMFKVVGDVKPIGQKGWKKVEHKQNKWAKANGYAVRPPSHREQYLRLKKPTGDAECLPEVKCAHELEALINECVGTCELSDAESQSEDDSSDVEVTAVARRAPSPLLKRKSRASGRDLSAVFDPEAQRSRNDARTHCSSENTQILTLTQQVRDAQALSESLQAQNTVLQGHLHDVERQLDRVTMRANIIAEFAQHGDQFSQRSEPQRGHTRRPSAPPCLRREPVRYSDDYNGNENPFEPSPFHPFPVPRKSRSRSRDSHAVSRRRTPTPGPSRLRNQLVVTPHRGESLTYIISPAPKESANK